MEPKAKIPTARTLNHFRKSHNEVADVSAVGRSQPSSGPPVYNIGQSPT